MDIINKDGRDILVPHIESVETRVVNTNKKINQVVVRLSSGERYEVFSGTPTACADFRVAFIAAIKGTNIPLPSIDWVSFEPAYPTVELGKVVHFQPFWNGAEAESSSFTYTSSNEAVVDVVLAELLGSGVGQAEITVGKDGKNEKGIVTVTPSKDGIMFEHLGSSIPVGGMLLNPLLNNGVAIPSASIVFHSSNPAVATVDSRGAVDVLAEGSTLIIADYNGHRYGHYIKGIPASRSALKSTTEATEKAPVRKSRAKKPE